MWQSLVYTPSPHPPTLFSVVNSVLDESQTYTPASKPTNVMQAWFVSLSDVVFFQGIAFSFFTCAVKVKMQFSGKPLPHAMIDAHYLTQNILAPWLSRVWMFMKPVRNTKRQLLWLHNIWFHVDFVVFNNRKSRDEMP